MASNIEPGGPSKPWKTTPVNPANAREKVRAFVDRVGAGEEEKSAAAACGFATHGRALSYVTELGFADRLRTARSIRAQVLAHEAMDIADSDDTPKAKLRVDVRKWLAKSYAPSTYGDKVAVETQEQRVVHTHFVSLIGERKAVSHTNGETPAHNAGTLPTPTGDAPDAPLPESTQGTPTPPNSLPDRISEGEATDRELESRDSDGSGPLAFLGDD